MNATYWYSAFNLCFWLMFQGKFRNSTFLENLSNQLIQRSNKYYTRITFLVVLNVCVWVLIVNATLQRVFQFDCHERTGCKQVPPKGHPSNVFKKFHKKSEKDFGIYFVLHICRLIVMKG